jgi:hypothetical protein
MEVSVSPLKLIFLILPILLFGCGGGDSSSDGSNLPIEETVEAFINPVEDTLQSDIFDPSDIAEEKSGTVFSLSDGYATYFSEEDVINDPDGYGAGKGTNGSDPDIVRNYIDEEPVDSFRLRYSWSEFKNIESKKLNVKWTGQLDIESDSATVYAIIDAGWASTNFSLDDELVESYVNCGPCIVSLELEQGSYEFEIDYHNHWHTTDVSVVFTSELPEKMDLAGARISVPSGDELVALTAYSGNSLYQKVVVEVPEGSETITVVASSYDPVHWVFEGATDRISKVFYYSYSMNSDVTGVESESLGYWVYSDEEEIVTTVRNMSGRSPGYLFDEYSPKRIVLDLDYESSIKFTKDKILINNLNGLNSEFYSVRSAVGGPEFATRFDIDMPVMLNDVTWLAWSEEEPSLSGLSRDFKIVVHSGNDSPELQEIEEIITAKATYYLSADTGYVYQVVAEFAEKHVLQPGTYWISMSHNKGLTEEEFWVVKEQDDSLQGGSIRIPEFDFWFSGDEPPATSTTSRGVNMILSGFE